MGRDGRRGSWSPGKRAADVAAAAANERVLREAPDTGFATLAELVAFEMAA